MSDARKKTTHVAHESQGRTPKSTDSYPTWWSYWERKYGRTQVTYAHAMETSYVRIWGELNKLADDWERDKQGLYDGFVVLYMMQLVDRWTLRFGEIDDYAQMGAYYLSRIADGCIERMRAAVQSCPSEMLGIRDDAYRQGLASVLAEGLLGKPDHSGMPWFQVYKLLWSTWLNDRVLLEQERARLRPLAQDPYQDARKREGAIHLLVSLDLVAGEDDNAWERITTGLRNVELEAWFPYLTEMAEKQEWERLQQWLIWLRPYVDKVYLSQETEMYLELWEKVEEHATAFAEAAYRETLVRLLPASFWAYEAFLLRREEYRTWADACVMLGHSPLHLQPDVLKRVEKADARLLLPLYHYAIEKQITAGHREAYKSAVKLLKKLDLLYKKLKATPQYEEYGARLLAQYARHRAFQEELKKGKLFIYHD
ncbi:hypothetical protein [Paenibacillus ferrarius]|uniref:hypothetical protein n=1 Tax=Paenibacillus ferrarius TaxID=1469647 RepID=UPI003D27E876